MVTILACIFVFGILITVHELGHFLTAKLTGMKVEEFAIGFGPEIFKTQEGETKYSLRALPLGGFNRISGMDPDDPQDERSFGSKPVKSRMLVILAGSLMNLILPVIIFWVQFMSSGISIPTNEPVFGSIVPKYAAAEAGLQAGDRVLSINGVQVTTWAQVHDLIAESGGKAIQLEIDRNQQKLAVQVQPTANPDTGKPFIGVMGSTEMKKLGLVDSLVTSVKYTGFIIVSMVSALYHMIIGSTAADVSGPIGVAKMAGEVAQKGIGLLFNFVALLSLNLAVINMLPLPALDGGYFFLLLWEGLTGHKVSQEAMMRIQQVGVAMIVALTLFATYKDLMR